MYFERKLKYIKDRDSRPTKMIVTTPADVRCIYHLDYTIRASQFKSDFFTPEMLVFIRKNHYAHFMERVYHIWEALGDFDERFPLSIPEIKKWMQQDWKQEDIDSLTPSQLIMMLRFNQAAFLNEFITSKPGSYHLDITAISELSKAWGFEFSGKQTELLEFLKI